MPCGRSVLAAYHRRFPKTGFEMSAARVLVVDDEPVVLELVSRMLSHKGYQVITTGSPRQALKIVRENPPIDVVVSDICMPEMQGPELVSEVTKISPQTARVLMTGGIVNPAEMPSGVQVLHKPFSLEVLISAIEAALARSAQLSNEFARARQERAQLRSQKEELLLECQEIIYDTRNTIQRSRALIEGQDGAPRKAVPSTGQESEVTTLTSREIEVLKLIVAGLTSKKIAHRLGIAFKTVVAHRSHIMTTLHIHNEVDLLRYAIRQKLIEP
jgi:DNA-binding NarL/FixJ family response regulator